MRSLRIAAFVSAALLVAAPAVAQHNQASSVPRECRRIMKQLIRYQGDVERARERDNDLWENATLAHMGRLEGRLEARCPELVRGNPVAEFFAKVIDIAAEAAWQYLTWKY